MRTLCVMDVVDVKTNIDEIYNSISYISNSLESIKDTFTREDEEQMHLSLDEIRRAVEVFEGNFLCADIPISNYKRTSSIKEEHTNDSQQ